MAVITSWALPFQSAYDDTTTAQYTFSFAAITADKTVTVPNANVDLTFLGDVVAGTAAVNRAVVLTTGNTIDTINVTSLQIGGVTVSSSAAELNFLDGSIAGTSVASKALVLGASKETDTLSVTGALDVGSLTVGGITLDNIRVVDVVVAFSDLAAAGTKTILAGVGGKSFEVLDIQMSAAGTEFDNGGNRQLNIQDASGTVIYTTMPKTALRGLQASRWGQSSDIPFPATAANIFASTTTGESLVAKYSGGSTDYTAGSVTFRVTIKIS